MNIRRRSRAAICGGRGAMRRGGLVRSGGVAGRHGAGDEPCGHGAHRRVEDRARSEPIGALASQLRKQCWHRARRSSSATSWSRRSSSGRTSRSRTTDGLRSYVVAFDRASGEEQWRTPALGEWPTALGIAAGGGRVFAADYAGSTAHGDRPGDRGAPVDRRRAHLAGATAGGGRQRGLREHGRQQR